MSYNTKLTDEQKKIIPPFSPPLTITEKAGKKYTMELLRLIEKGSLLLTFPDGTTEHYGDGSGFEFQMNIKNNSLFSKLLWDGEIAIGEGYVDNDWDTNDLPGLLEFITKQLPFEKRPVLSIPKQLIGKIYHYLRRNTLKSAQKNMHDHYDIMNDFFFLILDKRKLYSSGIYLSSDENLEQAQLNKINALIRKADLKKDDKVLEIGFGWGAFALEAAKTVGCHVTGVTLSKNQLQYVSELIHAAKLDNYVDLKFQDYREIEGQFDKIVSIEMLEHVGDEFLPIFFKKCDQLLKPGGTFALQTIVYPDEFYEQYKNEIDWVKKHIFPGGHLPCLQIIEKIVSKQTNLKIISIDRIGLSYAKTLSKWRSNLIHNQEKVKQLGFNDSFIRKWIYYFAFCEAGFSSGHLDDCQIVLQKK
jgi:cyclopropane-fatty-acyl-phospholipid synthase